MEFLELLGRRLFMCPPPPGMAGAWVAKLAKLHLCPVIFYQFIQATEAGSVPS